MTALSGKIARRAWLGAIYLALNLLALVLVAEPSLKLRESLILLPALLLVSVVLAHLGYEMVVPVQRRLSVSPVEKGFRDVAGGLDGVQTINYEFLRSWRLTFVNSKSPKNLRDEIEHNINFRRLLSHLVGACAIWLLVLVCVAFFADRIRHFLVTESVVAMGVLIVASIGHYNRSHALGRSYGQAYVYYSKPNHPRSETRNKTVPAKPGLRVQK